MITTQVSAYPEALMFERGGSIGAAMRITGEVIQRVVDAGATPANGREPRASWVAIIGHDSRESPGVEVIDWDPTQPIPCGTLQLRCTGYSVSTTTEGEA